MSDELLSDLDTLLDQLEYIKKQDGSNSGRQALSAGDSLDRPLSKRLRKTSEEATALHRMTQAQRGEGAKEEGEISPEQEEEIQNKMVEEYLREKILKDFKI